MRRPNIVFILADDMGFWTLGSAGNRDAVTPNLDDMARNGCTAENFFCSSPVCSPARATLLTGRMPSMHGILDWILQGNMENEGEKPIEYLEEFKGYTDYLSEAGYVCGVSGKWHLGDSEKRQKGFSHWYVHQSGGGNYYDAPMIREGKRVREPGYVTELITRDAVRFLRDREGKDEPFYLSVNFTAPHTPWIHNHPQKYLDLYRDCTFNSCPVEKRHPWQIDFSEFNYDRKEMLKGYFAATSALDFGVGEIREELRRLNLDRDTLILFSSDNGFNCGHHGIWGKGNGTSPFNMYDTSVKVPLIACMPGKIRPGIRLKGLYSAYDFFPTIMEIAGLAYKEKDLPGKSFAKAIFTGEEREINDCVVVYSEYGAVRMVRQREWKYIRRYPEGPDELYNLKTDPGEMLNMIDKAAPELIELLNKRLESWFSEYARPETDGRQVSVTGAGQNKKHTASGFEPGSFQMGYETLPVRQA